MYMDTKVKADTSSNFLKRLFGITSWGNQLILFMQHLKVDMAHIMTE